MAGKAHGGLVIGIFAALLWAGMNAGTNAEGAEGIRGRTQKAQREYGGERKRRKGYAEVAKEIPKLFGKG